MNAPHHSPSKKENIFLGLLLTPIFCCVIGCFLAVYNLLPLIVVVITAALGGLIALLCALWQAFPNVLPAAWKRAPHRRFTVIVSLFLAIVISFLLVLTTLLTSRTSASTTLSSPPVPHITPSPIVPTSTATPRATPTASATAPTPQATPFLSDPMTASQNGGEWDVSNDSGSGHDGAGSCGFEADGYHIRADLNYRECLDYRDADLANFQLEARITFVKGNSGGVMLRRDPGQKEEDYLVEFDRNTGHYVVYKDPKNAIVLREAFSSLIQKGQASYLIEVTAVGNQITLLIDHQQIVRVADKNNTYRQGKIGFYTTGHEGLPTEVVVTNVTIATL